MQVLSFYQQRIARLVPDVDARHVEGWMRIEYGTLDHLGPEQFDHEVKVARECTLAAGPGESEALAVSMGL